jgi:anti-sigma B factor antagonist
MEITFAQHDQVVVVSIQGSIDSLNADQLTEAFTVHLAGGAVRLVADFGGVHYTSSAGLRSLLSTVKDSRRKGGDLRIAAVQPAVERVLSLSGFTSIIKTFPSVTLAVASYTA